MLLKLLSAYCNKQFGIRPWWGFKNEHLCKKNELNFLAHLFLAGSDEGLIIGNFIADMVKGKAYLKYSESVQKGILLHRKIDFFTDQHPLFRKTKYRIQKEQGRYSPVIVDLYYDHFLALEWSRFSNQNLDIFVEEKYAILQKNKIHLPDRAQYILPFMVQQNWLLNYAYLKPLAQIFDRMDRRTDYQSGMKIAVETLQKYYAEIQNDFLLFMPEVIDFVEQVKKKQA